MKGYFTMPYAYLLDDNLVGRLLDDSHRGLTGSAAAAQRGDDVT